MQTSEARGATSTSAPLGMWTKSCGTPNPLSCHWATHQVRVRHQTENRERAWCYSVTISASPRAPT